MSEALRTNFVILVSDGKELHQDTLSPLHELWLVDPGGNLVEVYARLTDAELAEMPEDREPVVLSLVAYGA